MLHHVSIGVSDVVRAAEFYDAVLGALGYKRTAQYLPYAIAYGEGVSEFWIQLPHDSQPPSSGNGVHFGFSARSRDAVHRFHEAALGHGGRDAGGPGPRADYGPEYYGAFVHDPYGNKVEATLRLVSPKMRATPSRRPASHAKRTPKRTAAAKPAAKAARRTARTAKRKARRR